MMDEIRQYIINNMRGRSKCDIEDYIISFYTDKQVSEERVNNLLAWLDEIYDAVLA